MNQAEAESPAAADEGPLQRAEATVRAQAPDLGANPHGHVESASAESPPPPVWNIRSRCLPFSPRPAPRAAPLRKREFLLVWLHRAMIARGSDIARIAQQVGRRGTVNGMSAQ